MRKYLIIVQLIVAVSLSFGQESTNMLSHQISADFGSFRGRYVFPMTNIIYNSPLLKKMNVKFSARLRSYGTLFFVTKDAYDFTPLGEYYFSNLVRPIYFSVGLGLDTRIRLVNDERSEATTSIEPIVSVAVHAKYKAFSCSLPIWTRLYSNGISVTALPEISYSISPKVSIYLRYELSYLSIYKTDTHEWRHDTFIGTRFSFLP